MPERNLLERYPKARRNVAARAASKAENRELAMKFGREYFDGTREQGYGGFRYDGRWLPIAEDIVRHYGLRAGDRVLDIGCAKGFLVKDLQIVCPGLEAYGIDISEYAIAHSEPEVRGHLSVANATDLPFGDGAFTVALSINTIHNLDRDGCVRALGEMMRVAPRHHYIQVDAYRTPAEERVFLDWVLTAKTHGTPAFWLALLNEVGYNGEYYWTILDIDPQWTMTS